MRPHGAAAALATLWLASAACADTLVWIHAEANEGGASGGHAALRLGERVYHYQTIDGRTELSRWPWPRFRRLYNDLENRALHEVAHPVPPGTRERVRRHLDRIHVEQQRRLGRLADLAFQRELLEGWQRGHEAQVDVPGVGLFDPGGSEPASDALLRAVERAHGPQFLQDLRRSTRRALRRIDLQQDDAALAYRDELLLAEALDVLARGRRVAPERRLRAALALGERERSWQRRVLDALEARVVDLVASPRPDRGFALLLAIARHRTLERGLAEGRLYTLDPFPRDAPRMDAPRRAARRAVFEGMARRLASELATYHRSLVERGDLREPDLRGLEAMAAAAFEVRRALDSGAPIRLLSRIETPARAGSLRVARPALAPGAQLEQAVARVRRNEAQLHARVQQRMGYHVLRRNCATELLRAVQAGFPSESAAAAALGGRVDPADGLHFAPFAWLDAIERGFRGTRRSTLPPYRTRALAEAGHSTTERLAEHTTLTSRLYVGHPADSHFLFFTQDAAPLRPLLGTVNLAYALGQGALGLVTWPLDRGERLDRGLRGAIFSLPELAFVSLRKGSFEDVPQSR